MKFSLTQAVTFFSALTLAAPAPVPVAGIEARGCSCHKVGDEYVCGGSTCPRDLALSAMDELMKRGCSCHKVGDEYVCGGSTCP
ncbi:hypothetical protein VTL71DRAFT_4400 [Oculimacula yallundae]|uniref:Uncharacterized protein n=1 Tax=Oculimacula yallundae TaxID=86028 RepID=A0ABR4C320_9HELO